MIDFSTLQGLTIPEGVVAEIKDASGRVLWNAERTVSTVHLRPSADISVGHLLHPANSILAYPLVSEKVNDAAATYIYSIHKDKNANDSAMSVFALYPTELIKSSGVTGGKLVFNYTRYSGVTYPNIENFLTVDGEAQIKYYSNPAGAYEPRERDLSTTELEAINKYISQNGKIPPITLQIKTNATKSSSKEDGLMCVGQIYLELTGEFVVKGGENL